MVRSSPSGVGGSLRLLGQHEVLIRLASGGAANVFLIRDTAAPPPGRLLALKILLPSLAANEDFLNMFFTEARIAARLEHPNIVAIAGFGQVEGIHCLAMEYVFGASLAQVLRASARAKKPLTVGVLLRITAAVCDALHYAHEMKDEEGRSMGLVHRDVTPQNILIGFNGVPKITDFGIAKATNRGWETQAGIVKGKFSYMSPEQALGKRVDRRSDIFGAGIVLWEALTGRDLFRGNSPLEVLMAIREQKIEPPSKVVPGLTPIVDPIVMKALKRAPRQRFQTALEMKKEIEDLIDRAGVTIDSTTISREFAAIYGDEIVNRAFALRAAMAGRADLDQLAEALGGQKLNPKHIPVIPGGVTNPDPLGLFSEPAPAVKEADQPKNGNVLPARSDHPFTLPNAAAVTGTTSALDDVEIIDGQEAQEAAIDLAEIARLEPDIPKPRSIEDSDVIERPVRGWDDSTAMSIPSDELLSMISEDDATVGYLPEAFAERFGKELKRALEERIDEAGPGDEGFEDELTVGMPGPGPAKPTQVNDSWGAGPTAAGPIHRRDARWPESQQPVMRSTRREGSKDAASGTGDLAQPKKREAPVIAPLPTEPNGAFARSLRPIPRAPSLDLDRDRAAGSVTARREIAIASAPTAALPGPPRHGGGANFALRTIPRAPSLDMDEVGGTPAPELEDLSPAAGLELSGFHQAPVDHGPPEGSRPSRPPPPPPPARASSAPLLLEESLMPELEIDLASRPGLLATLEPNEAEPPSMPGAAVLEPLTHDTESPEPTIPGAIEAGPGGAEHLELELVQGWPLMPAPGSNGTSRQEVSAPGAGPAFPDALRALETASAPPSSPAMIEEPPLPILSSPALVVPTPALPRARRSTRGIQIPPALFVVMVLGLIALGMVLGILLTRSG